VREKEEKKVVFVFVFGGEERENREGAGLTVQSGCRNVRVGPPILLW